MPYSCGVSLSSWPSLEDEPARVVHHQVTRREGRRIGGLRAPVAAQGGADSGRQLVHAERLGQVIVRAFIERLHLLPLLGAGGQDEDGHVAPGPQAAADLQPVHAGHHQVQDDQVRHGCRRKAQGLLAVRRRADLVALRAQAAQHSAADLRLVVHDKDRSGLGLHNDSLLRGQEERKDGTGRLAWGGAARPDAPAVGGDDCPAEG